jgi:hypothetical protein
MSIGPARWLGGFRIDQNVTPELAAKIGDGSENAAADHTALDLGKPEFDLIGHDE